MGSKIDFVLPWVDDNDLSWRNKREKYSVQSKINNSNSNFRFRDFNTLKFVLRSIEKNCPWYNRIYLITEGHYPSWLNIHHNKIVLVTHEELYFDATNLPTFNSSSIEMNLANLVGLSEHFVYLNDDTIILNPIDKSRFFVNNLPVDFLCHGWLPRKKIFSLFRPISIWEHSLNNNLHLVNKFKSSIALDNDKLFHSSYSLLNKISNFLLKYLFKHYFWLEHWHHPQPYNKNTIKQVRFLFEKEMTICSKNKFRYHSDLTHYLYRYWHLVNGMFYPFKYNDAIVENISSVSNFNKLIRKLNNYNFKFVCFNDSEKLSYDEFNKVKNILYDFLFEKFPTEASFEIISNK